MESSRARFLWTIAAHELFCNDYSPKESVTQYITGSHSTPQYTVMWFGDGQLRAEMGAVT